MGDLEEGGVGKEGLTVAVESGISCQTQKEPLQGLRQGSQRLGLENGMSRDNPLLRKQGFCLEVNDQGQVRDNHDSVWCRDSGNGEKWTDLGCIDILEVNLIGLPD